ncbi:acyl-CoA thioesterase [Streptomyces sp. 351MFTsu5.1]|uniref:acyl-CoA thioesterase n=1 Tax=Streptomyces sp. 351MFTsu5.1 TaxID=1172180 RepID=UPI00035DFA78|nr:thioesterase family protein [Streptomyces sp. 351MFTsu5.1]
MTAYQHRVRYHEADAQGFLFNARYLELADVAMTEFFRGIGWPYADLVAGGTDPSVVSATLTFSRPARFDDLLDITARCTRVGTSSFGLDVLVARGADTIATIGLVYVNVDAVSATSRPLPDSLAKALRSTIADL